MEHAFGIIVGGQLVRIGDEGNYRDPVIEDFVGQPAYRGIDLMAIALAVPLDVRGQALDCSGVSPSCTRSIRRRRSRTKSGPKPDPAP